jgi:hypothetical protein
MNDPLIRTTACLPVVRRPVENGDRFNAAVHGKEARAGPQGVDPGGTRRLVACSNAYASSINRGSLQLMPAKLTPKGARLASKPVGKAGLGAFATMPNGTRTVG